MNDPDPRPASASALEPVRILVVDDEVANVDALRATLTARGYEVLGFTDARAALDALNYGRFALLLADLNMPEMGGVELLREAQGRDPDLVGLIMTGEGTIATAVEAMKSGALDYVLKPLKLGTLLPVISRALTERQLRLDNAQLERGLRERTKELEEALLEVQWQINEKFKAEQALMQAQKMEAIGRLTGGVAHDFNNLLAAVIGNLQLLQRRIETDAPHRRFVDNALEAANRGAKVTGQLLAFSRTQRMSLEPVEVDETLSRGDALLRHALGPDVELNIKLGWAGAWSNTDATQLELAVLNLIVNARDALPAGGEIRLRTVVDAGRIVIEVADDGFGMSEDDLARAAEPFFTTKKGTGSGLGLAQVYGFARQSGGNCEITSKLGGGTRVRILLPQIEPPNIEPAPAIVEPTRTDTQRTLTVLVVDDDDLVRRSLCDGLASEGFIVLEAADGPAGLALLDAERPDALVLDYAMPVMTGAEVARRAQAKYPHLPIVFCSGYSDSLALDEIGAAMVLKKPITIEDLSRAVWTVVGAEE